MGDKLKSSTRHAPRRGLTREEAALYCGISPSYFDILRKAGKIGAPRVIGERRVYLIDSLDQFLDGLPVLNHDTSDEWRASV